MKKKTLLLIIAVIVALYIIGTIGSGTDPDTAGTQTPSDTPSQPVSINPEPVLSPAGTQTPGDTPTSPVSETDLLSILFHQPYLEVADIRVNHESERKKMPSKISDTLDEEPKIVKLEDGGLFGTDYYTQTNQSNYASSSVYCYYGKVKDNKPDGFGVLSDEPVDLRDLDTIGYLIYAGDFSKGIYDGYGALFNPDNTGAPRVSECVINGLLKEEYIDTAYAYYRAYVNYDGGWENGQAEGKGNIFWLDNSELRLSAPPQENYWGGIYYPSIEVADMKDNFQNGNTKTYASGVLTYDGQTKNGRPDGKGIKYFLNGQIQYDGQWKNGSYDGKGKLYDENGKLVYSGKWENGDYAS